MPYLVPVLTALYLCAIVAANLLTAAYGPGISVLTSFVLIGLTLSVRDTLHDAWGERRVPYLLALIGAGGVISYALNAGAGQIALASLAAFVVSESLDSAAYHAQRRRPYLIRSNSSNLLGAACDSVLFPVLAFGGFPVWIILGQFAAKVLGGLLWSLWLNRVRSRRTRVSALSSR